MVLDIDGTLLDLHGEISPVTHQAIAAAIAHGCLVTLATGRRFRSALPIATALGFDLPILVQNGALIKHSGTFEVLYHHHLDLAAAHQAVAFLWKAGLQPIVYENVFQGDHIHAGPPERDTPANRSYLERSTEWLIRHATLAGLLLPHPPLEVMTFDAPHRLEGLQDRFDIPGLRVIATTNREGTSFWEILAQQCSKAQALHTLLCHFDIPLAATMAIGDNYNDLELLQTAGWSVAMGNAPLAVQCQADAVTLDCDHDGVAVAIDRFVLDGALGLARRADDARGILLSGEGVR
ncbi:MAG: Cof-type HAD-IIB family hydrolase [Chloroflexi bacterium]|nr:Cof-type HAD-IIB family hydrolase [Chloroflexota bacterium]